MNQYPQQYLYRRIVKAKRYIDENYPHQIDLDQISGTAAFSKFHFIRLFKSIYGKTPHQYLIDVRIHRAAELLQTGESVGNACNSVGFESPGSFSLLFRKTFQLSPQAYSKKHQIKKTELLSYPHKHIPSCFASQLSWL